jgi:four helix bundle protein
MGEIKTFEDLEVWKKGCQLAVEVIADFNTFSIFSLKDQIQRSALSIPSNIAEGSERDSTADYIKFLRYSKASCGKLRTQLYITQKINKQLNLNTELKLNHKIDETKSISKMLQALINSLKAKTIAKH